MKFLRTTPLDNKFDPEKISIWKSCLEIMPHSDAYALANMLMDMNIENVSDYLKWGLHSGEVEDNGDTRIMSMIHQQEPRADNSVIFNLGRLHEHLKNFREKRNASAKQTTVNKDRKRRLRIAAENRDRGSSTTSYKPPETLDDFIYIHGREFREDMKQRADLVSNNTLEDENPKPKKRSRTITATEYDLEKETIEISEIKERLFEIALRWTEHSGFMKAARAVCLPFKDTKTNLYIAATSSIKTVKTLKLYCDRLEQLTEFLEEREVPEKFWSGRVSVFFIAEFLRKFNATATVPHFVKTALKFCASVLEIDWQLDHPIIFNSSKIKQKHEKKQAPALEVRHIKALENMACDENKPRGLRIFCACILLLTHASLRWSDALSIEDLRLENGVIRGTLTKTKTSDKPAPFACPEKGFKELNWPHPLFEFREIARLKQGFFPRFTFPKLRCGNPDLESSWILEKQICPAPKRQVESRSRQLLTSIGIPDHTDVMKYTLHSPRNFYTNGADQIGWSTESQTILGRWSKNSKMPEHYLRSKGTRELQLRHDLSERIRLGWEPVGSHQIPNPPPASSAHSSRQDTHLSVNSLD